ncbi:MAG: TMEM165/GDT1 family protein [Gammaproteobacteria bacterium]|nr:TMEM165/GDT1 family protein [Gammaproteobacteria bacterium]
MTFDWKAALAIFATVFLAELGDKTQLATLLYASDGKASRWTVFISASLALIASVAIAVLAGGFVAQYVSPRVLRYVAGTGFIAIGIWTLTTH